FSSGWNIMVQTRKQLSQIHQQDAEKTTRSRSVLPISGRITSFFQMRKRKNSSERKDVEVLGKRLRSDVNVKPQEVQPEVINGRSPMGIFDRLPDHIFDTFAENCSWRSLAKVAQTSRTCAVRIVNFIRRDVCVNRFVRDSEIYGITKTKTTVDNPFTNLGHLCRTVFYASECSQQLLQFCTKVSAKITDLKSWSRFLFNISTLIASSSGNFDHCKQIIDLVLEMKITWINEDNVVKKRAIREFISEVVHSQQAGDLQKEEMKVREVIRDLVIDQTHLDDQQQAIWMTCLMRTFPKLQQQARLLMIALAPTMKEGVSDVIDWRSLCDRDVSDQNDAELRIKPLALFISKLSTLNVSRDRSMSWTNTELFNLIEEVSTCPEPWAFDNFIAFLIQEPLLIPIALTARMTHDYVEEAGNLVSAMKTLLFRWNIDVKKALSDAFTSTMKSLSVNLRREFLSSVHEAHARSIKSLVTSTRVEIQEEMKAQAEFNPLLQEVIILL
ncbi:prom-1, partial [Pristionchus pacificus]